MAPFSRSGWAHHFGLVAAACCGSGGGSGGCCKGPPRHWRCGRGCSASDAHVGVVGAARLRCWWHCGRSLVELERTDFGYATGGAVPMASARLACNGRRSCGGRCWAFRVALIALELSCLACAWGARLVSGLGPAVSPRKAGRPCAAAPCALCRASPCAFAALASSVQHLALSGFPLVRLRLLPPSCGCTRAWLIW